jgi:hypothetical protein
MGNSGFAEFRRKRQAVAIAVDAASKRIENERGGLARVAAFQSCEALLEQLAEA